MRIREFVQRCPASAALFATEHCAPAQVVTVMIHRYLPTSRPGSGYQPTYSAATWRYLVALRLTSDAMRDLNGTTTGVGEPARRLLSDAVRDGMPPTLLLSTHLANLFVDVPDVIRREMQQLSLVATL